MSTTVNSHFDAIRVVSPLARGGEDKNQDRASWYAAIGVASVCDGVTSSPYGGDAAELVAGIAPMLFNGQTPDRLGAVCELLAARRLEAQSKDVALPPDTPPGMREMLAEVTEARMRSAFQTTLVAASFTVTDNDVMVDVLRCGDSVFFAFSPAGELLTSSPLYRHTEADVDAQRADDPDNIRFGPGDELLVKVLGRASRRAFPAGAVQIQPKHRARWLVCAVLDRCAGPRAPTNLQGNELPTLLLTRRDLLLIPEFLLGRVACDQGQQYRSVPYSSSIRLASRPTPDVPAISFNGKSAVTHVLPDHYFTGRWVHRREHLPRDGHFVLASDGFYGAFDQPLQLWQWLSQNRSRLVDPAQHRDLMEELHNRLHNKTGDDDISFVWVFPRKPARRKRANHRRRDSSRGKGNGA